MRRSLYLIFALLLMVAMNACHYTDIVPDDGSGTEVPEVVSFSSDIEPIFKSQSCTNCHPAMSQPDLSAGNAYESLSKGGYFDTKNPEDSEIYTEPSPDSSHAGKYTAAQAQLILAWIEQGAENN